METSIETMVGVENRNLVTFPSSQCPILLVVVDTEEEFDWNARYSRFATSVTAMADIHKFQGVCDEFGIS